MKTSSRKDSIGSYQERPADAGRFVLDVRQATRLIS
jgi:hypothetical protein